MIQSLFGKFFKKSRQSESYYLSLVLAPDRVAASIWTFEEERIKEAGFDRKNFTNIDHLLHQAALAIDKAGEKAKVDVGKTVFGVTSDWLEDDKLSSKSQKLLKNLAEELDLAPQAYVPLATSVDHLLRVEQSPVPNFVAIGIFGQPQEQFCEIHQIVASKVIAHQTAQSPLTLEKIQALVKKLAGSDKLPPRVVIYGLDSASQLAQEISKSSWKDIFISDPRIDFLDDRQLARSVAYTQAADLLGHEPLSQATPIVTSTKEVDKPADELGFVESKDILLSQGPIKPPERGIKEEYAVEVESPNVAQEITPGQPLHSFAEKLRSFAKVPTRLLKPDIAKKAGIAAVAIFILIIVASYVAGQTLTSAQVIVKVAAQVVDGQFNANVAAGSYDASLSQIAGQAITVSAEGSQKAVTTGSKKIGEAAHGEITVFNWTQQPKSFTQGTTVITKSGLKFTLEEPVEATAASAPSGGNPGSPGKAKAKVTASDIGPQYNLEPGTTFTFTQFDEFSYSAQNEAPISGGSEKQTTVVTRQDMDRLQKSLFEIVAQKAKDEAKNKAQGLTLADEAIITKIVRSNFDKKEEEEASLLNLDLQIEADAIAFDPRQLQQLIAQNTTDLPKDLMVRSQDIQISQSRITRQDLKLQIAGRFKASLVPKFDEEELKAKIAGKSLKEARSIIREIPQVSDVNVNFSPNLPLVGNLPSNKAKISFKIEAL